MILSLADCLLHDRSQYVQSRPRSWDKNDRCGRPGSLIIKEAESGSCLHEYIDDDCRHTVRARQSNHERQLKCKVIWVTPTRKQSQKWLLRRIVTRVQPRSMNTSPETTCHDSYFASTWILNFLTSRGTQRSMWSPLRVVDSLLWTSVLREGRTSRQVQRTSARFRRERLDHTYGMSLRRT